MKLAGSRQKYLDSSTKLHSTSICAYNGAVPMCCTLMLRGVNMLRQECFNKHCCGQRSVARRTVGQAIIIHNIPHTHIRQQQQQCLNVLIFCVPRASVLKHRRPPPPPHPSAETFGIVLCAASRDHTVCRVCVRIIFGIDRSWRPPEHTHTPPRDCYSSVSDVGCTGIIPNTRMDIVCACSINQSLAYW